MPPKITREAPLGTTTPPVESITENETLNRGVSYPVNIPENVGVTEIPATAVVQDIYVEAVSKTGKENLTTEPYILRGKTGATLVTGGQDASGAEIFDGGRVQATLVSADGCSFGGKKESAEAARTATEACLYQTALIAKNPNLNRDEILEKMGDSLRSAQQRIKSEVGDNAATTIAVACIAQEKTENGDKIYLYVTSCGDPEVTILSTLPDGSPKIRRIVEPADQVDKSLRASGLNLENLPVNQAREQRKKFIEERSVSMGIPFETAEQILTKSGIYGFLGGENSDLQVRVFRVNISDSVFANGETDVKIMVSSDNAGEKLSKKLVANVYKETKGLGNREFSKALDSIMSRRDEDDGSSAIATIVNPKI